MSDAALQENWSRVAELAGGGEGLSPVERLLAGHAELTLNRNNESMASFLSVLSPDDSADELGQWLQWAREFREKNPASAIACYFEGDALARLQQWPAAIDAFNAGLKLAPGNALLLNARGVSFAATWEMDRAVVDLTAATKANPRLADAFQNLGSTWVQRQTGAIGARRALDNALVLSPDSVVALTLRGGVFLVQQKPLNAQADVEQAAKQAGPLAQAVHGRIQNMVGLMSHPHATEMQLARADGENPGMYMHRQTDLLPKPTDTLPGAAGGANDLILGARYARAIGLSQASYPANHIPDSSAPNSSPSMNLSALNVVADHVTNMASGADALKSFLPQPYQKGLEPAISRFQLVGAIGGALSGDLGDALRSGNFDSLQSRLLEQLGRTGLSGLGHWAEDLRQAGRLDQSWIDHMSLLGPLQDLTAAGASQLGAGRLLPNEMERSLYLGAAHDLLSADFNLRYIVPTSTKSLADLSMAAKWGSGASLGATAALPDLANFAQSRMARTLAAPMTVNESIHLFDGIAKGTAYSAAFLATGGSTAAASAMSTLAGVTADKGRDWSMQVFQRADYGARGQIVDVWSQAVSRGQTTKNFSEWMGGWDETIKAGFTPMEISHLNDLVSSRSLYRPNTAFSTQRLFDSPATPAVGSVTPPKPLTPPAPIAPNVRPAPLPQPEFASVLNAFKTAVGGAVGSGSANAICPPPCGGLDTQITMPRWRDGEWPFTPWYGLGYGINDRPKQKASEVRQ